MSEYDRRSTDPLLLKILEGQAKTHSKLAELEKQMGPVLDFMNKVDGAKTALYWIFGLIALIAGIVTWALNVKDHIHH